MSRSLRLAFAGLLIPALLLVVPLAAQKGAQQGQWPSYSADHGSTGYSPIDLINRDNVKNLQIAWSWKFDNFGGTNTEVTPIMVNGILYFPLSPRRIIVAADAGTTELARSQGLIAEVLPLARIRPVIALREEALVGDLPVA